jgi:hypothetical protein
VYGVGKWGETYGGNQKDLLVRSPITVTPHRLPNQIDWIRFLFTPLNFTSPFRHFSLNFEKAVSLGFSTVL